MATDSAHTQPPIDTAAATSDECAKCGSPKVFLAGNARAARCVSCGLVVWHYPVPLVIAGPDLVSAIKFFAEEWQRLEEINESRMNILAEEPTSPGHPTWDQLYEAQVAEVANDIGEIRIPAEDT